MVNNKRGDNMIDAVILAIKGFIYGLCALICAFLGGFDKMIVVLAIFVTIDMITGIAKSFSKGEFKASVMFKGIGKKVIIFVVVGVANITDMYLLPTGGLIRLGALLYYAANEGLSIVENVVILGVPVPKVVQDAFKVLSKKSEDINITDNKDNEDTNTEG